ncbi:MAG: response regulator, partial [Verrucomicrobiota bacterium]
AFALGASDYLTKPVKKEDLIGVLQKCRIHEDEATVLLVEDSEDIRKLLVNLLNDEGMKVVEAANGRAGLDALETCEPSLILLDLMMPEMDGFEFAALVQNSEKWQQIPICVITSKHLTEEEEASLEGRVDEILEKSSYTQEELFKEIRYLLKRFIAKEVEI